MNRKKTFATLALLPLSVFVACSSSDESNRAPNPTPNQKASSSWAIKAYAKTDQGKNLVNFSQTHDKSNSPLISTNSLNLSVSTVGDGAASNIDSYRLLPIAARECSVNMGRFGVFNEPIPWEVFSENSYNTFVFTNPPNSCDDLLKMQEVTLCIADRLAEIADTVRPVEWPISGYTFPPQSEKDKFIVRDLAILALSNLGVLDIFPNSTSITGRQCSSLYAKAGTDSAFADTEKLKIFGSESETTAEGRYFSPLFLDTEVLSPELLSESARARLVHKTHVLRAGSRLLKELVDKSVQADLAGASLRRSKATDWLQGALLAWAGERGNSSSDDYYNSISRALRVVAGRWEMADQGPLGGVGGLSGALDAVFPVADVDELSEVCVRNVAISCHFSLGWRLPGRTPGRFNAAGCMAGGRCRCFPCGFSCWAQPLQMAWRHQCPSKL